MIGDYLSLPLNSDCLVLEFLFVCSVCFFFFVNKCDGVNQEMAKRFGNFVYVYVHMCPCSYIGMCHFYTKQPALREMCITISLYTVNSTLFDYYIYI